MAEAKQALEHDYEQKMDHLAMINEFLASQPEATYPEVHPPRVLLPQATAFPPPRTTTQAHNAAPARLLFPRPLLLRPHERSQRSPCPRLQVPIKHLFIYFLFLFF